MSLTATAIGLTCKSFIKLGLCSITVNGFHNLLNALNDPKRFQGRGVVTISNHISTLDDPLTWGILPTHFYWNTRMIRWTLGASDIMFTNPVFSTFFRNGQVLEVFRGRGIYQDAIDSAIKKLDDGQWIHLFGEGKVNQPDTYARDTSGVAILPRFRWGVGRIIASPATTPVVIPMWITGFEKLMPEGRPFPYKYFPRVGSRLSVTFGSPLPTEQVRETIEAARTSLPDKRDATIRTEVTALAHSAVQSLGRSVSGDSLGNL